MGDRWIDFVVIGGCVGAALGLILIMAINFASWLVAAIASGQPWTSYAIPLAIILGAVAGAFVGLWIALRSPQ